jgi:hypothetical protein
MTEFRQKIIEQLGMTLREGQTEFTDEDILRRVDTLDNAYRRVVERETQLEARFKKLSELAGEDLTREALDATPSEQKMEFLRWLDPSSDNFLGSGMSMQEYMMKRNVVDYNRNMMSQMNDEKRRRLQLIIRIAVALHNIRTEDLHGTASLERAIEDIIKGEPVKDFEQWIDFMTDSKWSGPAGEISDEEKAQWGAVWEKRMGLWAPAIRACREFHDAFKPPPEDRPRYSNWKEMLEKEGGMVRLTPDVHDGGVSGVWMKQVDAHHHGTPAMWNLMLFRGTDAWWEDMFEAGVRWRGPRRQDESGYWHREDGEKFPDNPEKFWGNNYHRIYWHRELSSWHYRQKDKAA